MNAPFLAVRRPPTLAYINNAHVISGRNGRALGTRGLVKPVLPLALQFASTQSNYKRTKPNIVWIRSRNVPGYGLGQLQNGDVHLQVFLLYWAPHSMGPQRSPLSRVVVVGVVVVVEIDSAGGVRQ